MKRQQRIAHSLGGVSADLELAMKFHFALGRMNVHVHGGGINFQKQTADRITTLHQRIVIAFDQRVVDAAVFHGPPVDENELAFARRA